MDFPEGSNMKAPKGVRNSFWGLSYFSKAGFKMGYPPILGNGGRTEEV